jgi:hypothetical protein
MIQLQHDRNQDSISTCLFIYFYRYNYLYLEGHVWSSRIFWMVDQVVADPSLKLPTLRGGTPGTNSRHQPPSAWQMSRCWVIWIFLVSDEFTEYSIQEPNTLA